MSRPRKEDEVAAATRRMEAAFWKLLEEVDYPEITVRRITQAAEVNRNSFYYHYENLEDLARSAFLANAQAARPRLQALIASTHEADAAARSSADVDAEAKASAGTDAHACTNTDAKANLGERMPTDASPIPGPIPDASAIASAERVMLCARSSSPLLRRMVGELLRQTWFDALGINGDVLTRDQQTQVEFIFGGLVAVLGSDVDTRSPLDVAHLAKSDLGHAAVEALWRIAEASRG